MRLNFTWVQSGPITGTLEKELFDFRVDTHQETLMNVRRMMKLGASVRLIVPLILLSALAVAVPIVPAGVTFSCPAGAPCRGNTYAVWIDGQVGNIVTMGIAIDTSLADFLVLNVGYISDIAFKPANWATITGVTLTDVTGGTGSWGYVPGGLGATGCGASGVGYHCFAGNPDLQFNGGDVLVWLISMNAPNGIGADISLKHLFHNAQGEKVGDLLSWAVPVQDEFAPPPPPEIPEPSTLGLLGAGLAVLAYRARGRKASN
jgi:hypothetical protein